MTSRYPDTLDLTGPQAALQVPSLWQELPAKRRRYMLWDAGHLHGPTVLAKFVSMANIAHAAWFEGKFLGIAWIIPLGTGSRCGLIHMACTGERWQAEAIGNVWIRNVVSEYYDSLLAYLPVAFRHVRSMVEDMGFRAVTRLPGAACLTMRHSRIMDAILYQKDLKDD